MSRQIIANTAAVATGHPHGASAGLEMLQDGGNAVDAAVAAMLALSVVIPGSVGLGGYGGSAVIRLAENQDRAGGKKHGVIAVDFDSRAPLGLRGERHRGPAVVSLRRTLGLGACRRRRPRPDLARVRHQVLARCRSRRFDSPRKALK